MVEQITTILFLSFVTLLIIFLAYYTTLIIGKKANSFAGNRRMQIIDRLSVGVGITITIVKINSKIYILSLAGKNLQVIDVIEAAEWESTTWSASHGEQMTKDKERFFPEQMKTIVDCSIGKFFKRGTEKNDKHDK